MDRRGVLQPSQKRGCPTTIKPSLMERIADYLVILDYESGRLLKIRLSEEDRRTASAFENAEAFVKSLSDKYGFSFKDSYWMSTETLDESSFNF